MSFVPIGLALLAGAISTLSPCVLPLLPIVVGSARQEGKLGPAALAGGVTVSFALAGSVLVAAFEALSLDPNAIRPVSGVMLVLVGLVLVVPRLRDGLSHLLQPLADSANAGSRVIGKGVASQAGLGVLLGFGWAPCVGPTLGAASILATQSGGLLPAGLTMLAFGLGAALPLAAMGYGARNWMRRRNNALVAAGQASQRFMGASLVVVGGLVLSGVDKMIEAVLVSVSPQWLTDLTTRF